MAGCRDACSYSVFVFIRSSVRFLFGGLENGGIDKDCQTREQSLLVGGCIRWEFHVQGNGIRNDFRQDALGLFEDDSQVGSIAVSAVVVLAGGVDSVGLLAASLAAGVALRAAVDAKATEAGRWMDQIHLGSGMVKDLHGRDAIRALFLDFSQIVAPARNDGLLVATALARTDRQVEGPIDGDDFVVRVELLDDHFERVARRAEHAAETIGILQRMKDLLVSDKVFDLGKVLASQTLLNATPTNLSIFQRLAIRQVGFHGIRATIVHNIGLHL